MSAASAPRVSVLMTVYNGGAYLAEAVDSVLAQTFLDFELVVVDDASTDGTPAVLERFARQDPRVRVLRRDSNGGPVAASNMGLAQARGGLIARLDADDVCRPERLQRQVQAFEARPELVLLGTAIDYIDGIGRCFGANEPPTDDVTLQAALVASGNPFCHSSVMMRADAVRSLGGYRQLVNRYALDYDLILRISELGAIGNLPDRLVRYRVHAGQITARKMAMQIQSAHVYRALTRQRRAGRTEDLARAVGEVDGARAVFRQALVEGYLGWADMIGHSDPRQARQLRWRAVCAAPWHPKVLRLMFERVRGALPWRRTA